METFSPQLFQIVREIGRGATATVYEAVYDGRERYAIKSIERHQLCTPEITRYVVQCARVCEYVVPPHILSPLYLAQREWQNLQREAEIMRVWRVRVFVCTRAD